MKSRYSEDEANDILRRAIELMPVKTAMTREQLQSVANEVGVSLDTLHEAEAELAADSANKVERRAYIASRRRRFFRHGLVFVVSLFMSFLAVNQINDPAVFALLDSVLICWTVVLAIHGFTAFQTRGLSFEKQYVEWRGVRAVLKLTDEELERFRWPQ